MLTAIIVGENAALVKYLRQVCAEFGDICIHKTIDGASRRYDIAAALSAYEPDVAFVDVSELDRPDSLAAVCLQELLPRRLRTVLVPLANQPGSESLEKASGGVTGPILTPPFDAEQLDRAVRAALRKKSSQQASHVLAVLPAKAGDGASTLAINLAGTAVRAFKKKTLYIEADLRSGAICHTLNLRPRFPVGEIFLNSGSLIDGWSGAVTPSHGVDILPTGGSTQTLRGSRWDFYRLLRFAREQYEVVVVDLPAGIDEVAEAVIAEADKVAMVCTPEPSSVGLISRRLRDLEAGGTRQGHVRLVMNRYAEGDLDPHELARVARREVSAVLPEDTKAAKAACRQSSLLSPGSRLLSAIVDLTGDLLQMPAPVRSFSLGDFVKGIAGKVAGTHYQAGDRRTEIN